MRIRRFPQRYANLKAGFTYAMGLFAMCGLSVNGYAVGLMPVPEPVEVKVKSYCTYDSASRRYHYHYSVSSGADTKGELRSLLIDVHRSPKHNRGGMDSSGLSIPLGATTSTFDERLADLGELLLPPGSGIVPVGQNVPTGWSGGVGRNGFARFSTRTGTARIQPGETKDGFELISVSIPSIRDAVVKPAWVLVVEKEASQELKQLAGEVRGRINVITQTLGPSEVSGFGTYEHWNRLAEDIARAVEIGWIPDSALAKEISDGLAAARAALDAKDGTLAKQFLEPLLDLMASSTESQRRREARDLIVLNVQSLIESTSDTPIAFSPSITLTPVVAEHVLGVEHVLRAKVVNTANRNEPVADMALTLRVVEGPQAGLQLREYSDANGEALFRYTGRKAGTDTLLLREEIQEAARSPDAGPARESAAAATGFGSDALENFHQRGFRAEAHAEVHWSGGPDLAVPLLVPPEIEGKGGETLRVMDNTVNAGRLPANDSITRYYLAAQQNPDPKQALVVGERRIGRLAPGASDDGEIQAFTLPPNLPHGHYYLAACADADDSVAELDETNNCSYSRVRGYYSMVVPMEKIDNLPPDCSKAVATPDSLWPPNHKLEYVDIAGVKDPDGHSVSLRIETIEQDEPVNGLGDGDTSPDGSGVGGNVAMLRKERSGTGNGRIYVIGFSATDALGASCRGGVTVGVAHDQAPGNTPLDDGVRYDSTAE